MSTIRLSGLVSNLDTDSIVEALVSAYDVKVENIEKEKTELEWTEDAWSDLNSQIYDLYSDTLSDMKYTNTYNSKTTTLSDSSVATITASSDAVNGTQTLEVTQLAKSGYLTGAELSTTDASTLSSSTTLSQLGYAGGSTSFDITLDGTTTSISVDGDTTISSIVTSLKSAGVNASFDSTNGRIFVNSTESGADADFTISVDSGDAVNSQAAMDALGLSTDSGAVKIDGQDAIIELNGAEFTSSSNTFTVNGLTIGVSDTTDGDVVTINTDTDYQAIYDKIKNFISEYNDLITEMDTLYNADSASGYEPLTDDEKEAMTDEEIEKWETKIKDALLRHDSTLGDLSTMMKNTMNSIIEVNGENYSLSTFGINTESYFTAEENERGVYHIDGDEDDSTTSGNTDQLMSAIMSDPDAVVEFFTSLTKDLYNNLTDRMSSTSLRSVYNVYNDKQMDEQIEEYEDEIEEWEDKISAMEDKYYSQFTAMEVALAELQENSSALSSLLGS